MPVRYFSFDGVKLGNEGARMAAASRGRIFYFIFCGELLKNLGRAKSEDRLEYRLRHYFSYSLLIIDEVGHLPFDPDAADMLFELIGKRYETKSTIIITNKPFGKWGRCLRGSNGRQRHARPAAAPQQGVHNTGPSFRTQDYNQGSDGDCTK